MAKLALKTYRQKRNFSRTKEPSGTVKVLPSDHLRFVIQKHAASHLHYDLRLELHGVFKSWAVTKGPSIDPSDKRLAVQVEDHPLAYGDFEGTIPEGEYGGGSVQLWDRGFWSPQGPRSAEDMLHSGDLKFILAGERLVGSWVLVRIKNNRGRDTRTNWLLIKHRDKYAQAGKNEALLSADRSIASGRTMQQIADGIGKSPKPFVLASPLLRKSNGLRDSKRSKSAAPKALSDPSFESRISGPPSVMSVTISNPHRVMWPDAADQIPVTKWDLAQYFEQVGAWMLPHLKGRPCSLLRAPSGISGQQFFQRHAMAGISKLLSLTNVSGDKAPFIQIDRIESLAAVAQMGALEIHPWNCLPRNPEFAGRLVFDLDPAPDVEFVKVIKAALEIRERLKAVGLSAFCKTTGGKGLHVVSPLKGGRHAVAWPAAKNFAHILCAQMSQDTPKQYLINMSKAQRMGKIFLDYLRNDRTSTAVAPLSPRARVGAPVSMPIHWKDANFGLEPKSFTIRSTPRILNKSKPWSDYGRAAASLADAIKKVVNGKKLKSRR